MRSIVFAEILVGFIVLHGLGLTGIASRPVRPVEAFILSWLL